MEKTEEESNIPGSKQLNMKKAFNFSIRSLLTACSKEDFRQAFSNFTGAEQERLHRLFIQVIATLHHSIEDEFECLCLETQAGKILDTVEEHIEEQNLDPLFHEKSNIAELGQSLSDAKRNEMLYLEDMLEKAEKDNRTLSDRLELLMKKKEEFSGTVARGDKLLSNIRSNVADSL